MGKPIKELFESIHGDRYQTNDDNILIKDIDEPCSFSAKCPVSKGCSFVKTGCLYIKLIQQNIDYKK